MKSVALMGLGTMGSGMARRLMGAGFPLAVYNRTRSRAESLGQEGAAIASTPRQAAAGADVVISLLADDPASRSAWLGEEGALAGAKPGAVLIESSTLSVPWVAELAAAAAARGCEFLDAPVTGSKPQAQSGGLLFLVGGDAAVLESVRDVLAPMSRGAVHLGPTGSGALMKLVNNFVCGVQAASLAEALAIVENSALDREKAIEILSTGAPGSPILRSLAARMTSRDYRPSFAAQLMAKDLTYAVAEALRHGVTLRTGPAALEAFRDAVAKGWGTEDIAAVVEPYRQGGRAR
jgi:3-hydroxyisobutyrate dehydrogenase